MCDGEMELLRVILNEGKTVGANNFHTVGELHPGIQKNVQKMGMITWVREVWRVYVGVCGVGMKIRTRSRTNHSWLQIMRELVAW